MASISWSSHDRSSGRPLRLISTIGLPVAFSAASNSCCASGNRMSVRTAASPDQWKLSPMAAITISACCAAVTASAIFSSVVSVSDEPSAYTRLTPVPRYFSVNPCNIGTLLFRSPRPAHSPFRLMESFMSGPTSARVLPLPFAMGSNWLSFFNSTTDAATASRAFAMNSGVIVLAFARSSSRYRYGSSNSPRRNFISRMRLAAWSMVSSETFPSFTDSVRYLI